MHIGKGGPHHPGSEGCSKEEAGGYEAGGADEGGEEGPVDGLPPGSWLGQKRPLPWPLKQHETAYEKEVENKNSKHRRLHAAVKTEKKILNQ